jgi:hypothetical protein
MEIKLFGKTLFSVTKGDRGNTLLLDVMASPKVKESAYLPDFQSLNGNAYFSDDDIISITTIQDFKKPKKKTVAKEKVAGPTPKGVYDLKLLHDQSFKLNTNEAYVEGQLSDFKDKLALIKAEEYDMRRGTEEIASIVMRLENRKKYSTHAKFYSELPYTTPSRIANVLKTNNHLKLGQVAQFLADMPKEAVEIMKTYEKETIALCDKKPVFYIIADKKDFKKSEQRRDPILLAQSPFGHFWQILGAWDKEMMLLEDL